MSDEKQSLGDAAKNGFKTLGAMIAAAAGKEVFSVVKKKLDAKLETLQKSANNPSKGTPSKKEKEAKKQAEQKYPDR